VRNLRVPRDCHSPASQPATTGGSYPLSLDQVSENFPKEIPQSAALINHRRPMWAWSFPDQVRVWIAGRGRQPRSDDSRLLVGRFIARPASKKCQELVIVQQNTSKRVGLCRFRGKSTMSLAVTRLPRLSAPLTQAAQHQFELETAFGLAVPEIENQLSLVSFSNLCGVTYCLLPPP